MKSELFKHWKEDMSAPTRCSSNSAVVAVVAIVSVIALAAKALAVITLVVVALETAVAGNKTVAVLLSAPILAALAVTEAEAESQELSILDDTPLVLAHSSTDGTWQFSWENELRTEEKVGEGKEFPRECSRKDLEESACGKNI